jgi:hypothetical protein
MYNSGNLELWNITQDGCITVCSQALFNIVGCLLDIKGVESIGYSLNGGSIIPIYFNVNANAQGRLEKTGHFNIDTIMVSEISSRDNLLSIQIKYKNKSTESHKVKFHIRDKEFEMPAFDLNLADIDRVEEVAQVVDGRWLINDDEENTRCLEVMSQDAGLDRIVLFGSDQWTTDYEINAVMQITKWTGSPHNVGLLFKWNPHEQGDGTWLPTKWSTGLGYYYSHCPGLRIRFGVDVHLDKNGKKIGDYIIAEQSFSPWRKFISNIKSRLNLWPPYYPQLVPGIKYCFKLRVSKDLYSLTVYKYGKVEPDPQIQIDKPVDRLPKGSVGVIAHRCGVRVYAYQVKPL